MPTTTRRTMLRATAAATATTSTVLGAPARAAEAGRDPLLRQLDDKIRAGMAKYQVPGVTVGLFYRGAEYVNGYGVTNVDYPVPVDGDTVFRVGSTTKTFTGTTIVRLVEQGKLALDAPVRTYLPDLRTADPSVAARVTVRQLLNHSAGWLGDDFEDTGPGDDAAVRYVAGMARLPQLTAPGTTFAYNNAALVLAGRLIEAVTGASYEAAARALVVDPLGLAHSRFFTDDIIGFNVAASHNVVDGKAVVEPAAFRVWRSLSAAGGLISSARDQLRYARFHLGDGTVPGGSQRLLSRPSLVGMRSRPGPGGTLFVEVDGIGVTWMLRPTAEGVRVVQHGGDWPGQHSGFMFVPERGFALTLLTNSEGGPALAAELFADDWALRRFAGLSNLPAVPRALSPGELAEYEGIYLQQAVGPDGRLQTGGLRLAGSGGRLAITDGETTFGVLAFYRKDFVLVLGPDGAPTHTRANFVRGADGTVAWLRLGGRLARHETGVSASKATTKAPNPLRPWLLPR